MLSFIQQLLMDGEFFQNVSMKLSTILLFVTFLLGKDTQGGVKLKKGLWYFVVALFS